MANKKAVTGTEASAWVTHSGVDPTTEVPYFGYKAQRSVVVKALKSAIAYLESFSNTDLKE